MLHPPRWDRVLLRSLICLAVAASTVPTLLTHAAALPGWRQGLGWLGTLLLCAAILIWGVTYEQRRPFPLPVWAGIVVVSATGVVLAVRTNGVSWIPYVWIPYLGAAAAGVAGLALPWTVLLAAPPILALGWCSWQPSHDLGTSFVNVCAAIAVAAVAVMRTRQREAAELAEAQRRVIEVERAKMRARAHSQEVAAQVHDVLAHTLSGLLVTLQGAALAARNEHVSPALTGRLDTAIGLARDGLAETRRAVESLQSADHGASSVDLDAWLAATLDRLQTGAGVSVQVSGTAAAIEPSWSELTRSVLMEALTNTMRHAAGAPVRLTFTDSPDAGVSVLSVGDPASFVDRHHPSGGHGLAGLSDRVRAKGGRLDYGAVDGGFEVRLHVSGGTVR